MFIDVYRFPWVFEKSKFWLKFRTKYESCKFVVRFQLHGDHRRNAFLLEGFKKSLFTIKTFTQGDLHSTLDALPGGFKFHWRDSNILPGGILLHWRDSDIHPGGLQFHWRDSDIYSVSEFNKFEPRLKSAKNLF